MAGLSGNYLAESRPLQRRVEVFQWTRSASVTRPLVEGGFDFMCLALAFTPVRRPPVDKELELSRSPCAVLTAPAVEDA
jgi:hypothetical protein